MGYHASHEQFSPSALLALVKRAEAAGFQSAMSSDHFHPWSERQGHSGFAWAWLGSAMEATRLPFGIISAPGWRYHPAVIAQGAATLCQMYPERLWLALGSGEAINEHFTGQGWPAKAERNARLKECVEIIRSLFAGETVSHRGLVNAVECKLYTLPERPPLLIGAAVSPETAYWVGDWADGLITVNADRDELAKVVKAFWRGGGEGKPMFLQVALSWAPSEAEALSEAHHQWRSNVLGGEVNWILRTPAEFDHATRFVQPEHMRSSVLISENLTQHAEWLATYVEMGFSEIQLHNVGRNQEAFLEAFGKAVLPSFQAGRA
jgi:coenzyme F420-dependent glucose-6-phosphate dehydrogenase